MVTRTKAVQSKTPSLRKASVDLQVRNWFGIKTGNLKLFFLIVCSQLQQLQRGRVIPQVVPLFTPLARLNVSYGNGTLA